MLLIAPLVTALYPAFGAAEKPPELGRLVRRGFSTMAVVLAPVVAILVVVATPVISIVFGRGSFDANDVERTATALAWYAPAVVAIGWREVAARAFYAAGDARTPVTVAVGAMALNVVGDVTIGRRYGVAGLALSTTLSIALAAVLNTVMLARRDRALAAAPLLGSVARVTLAALVGAGVALLVVAPLDASASAATWSAVLAVLVGAAGVTVGYAGVLLVLRAPELLTLGATARDLIGRRTPELP